jgi:threonine aldolase
MMLTTLMLMPKSNARLKPLSITPTQNTQSKTFLAFGHNGIAPKTGSEQSPLKTEYTGWLAIPPKVLDSFTHTFKEPKEDFTFAGDNFGPSDPSYLEMLTLANSKISDTYQYPPHGGALGQKAYEAFHATFCDKAEDPFYVAYLPTGTAANRLSVSPVLRSIDAIVAADMAHLVTREAGGTMAINRASVYTLPHKAGKLDVDTLNHFFEQFDQKKQWAYHGSATPRVISISQPSEYGTVYSDDEVKAIVKMARQHDMLVQMDGSRLFYVAAKQNRTLKSLTTDLGVDIVFLGGSKHKMVQAESVVFTPNFFSHVEHDDRLKNPDTLYKDFRKYMKQMGVNVGQVTGMQAQFALALENNHGVQLVSKANDLAEQLKDVLLEVKDAHLYLPVETNVVIMSLPDKVAKALMKRYELKVFPEKSPYGDDHTIVRFMTNASNTSKDIAALKTYLQDNHLLPVKKGMQSQVA